MTADELSRTDAKTRRPVDDWLISSMAIITAFEAKTRFGELLDRVANGEAVVITRHDRPVAHIIPEGRPSLEKVREAIEGLRRLREETAAQSEPVSDAEIRSLINEGRR